MLSILADSLLIATRLGTPSVHVHHAKRDAEVDQPSSAKRGWLARIAARM